MPKTRRPVQPVAVTGPEVLDQDMTARDICDTLKRLRFRNGPQVIALGDKEVLGLANAGADTSNSIKQASEFGIARGGQKLAGLLVFINDINALGLEVAQGMLLTNAFYWDRNEESRAWSQRYFQRRR